MRKQRFRGRAIAVVAMWQVGLSFKAPTAAASVDPPDGRAWYSAYATQFPNNTIAALWAVIDGVPQQYCTGFRSSATTVATAGHCVYASGGASPAPYKVVFGQDRNAAGGYMNVQTCLVTGWGVNGDYVLNHTSSRDAGRVVVDAGSCNGYGLFMPPRQLALSAGLVEMNVRGYPLDPPSPPNYLPGRPFVDADAGNFNQAYNGAAHADCAGMIAHRVDTTGGQSGSPTITPVAGVDRVVGVHTQGGLGLTSGCFWQKNASVRLTEASVRSSLGY